MDANASSALRKITIVQVSWWGSKEKLLQIAPLAKRIEEPKGFVAPGFRPAGVDVGVVPVRLAYTAIPVRGDVMFQDVRDT
jgi:hypothetical protein